MRVRITILLVLAAVTVFGVMPAYAGSIAVTSNLDDGIGCTLRDAIIRANAGSSGSGCTVVGTAPYTITLPANTYTVNSVIPVISVAIILNESGGDAIVQANASPNVANYRIFDVNTNGNLTLDGITVQNGGNLTSFASAGGCISVHGQLTLQNGVIVQNCRTQSTSGAIEGGASSVITITNSVIQNNIAQGNGGAVSSGNLLTVTNSQFINNSLNVVISGGRGSGGAITVSGTLSVTGSTFTGNSSVDPGTGANGGAIQINNGGTGTITGSTFTGNWVSANNQAYGGAVNVANLSVVTISDSVFSGNQSIGMGTSGGGAVTSQSGTINITTSRFETNSADTGGGAIYNYGTQNITISQTCITNNGDTAVLDATGAGLGGTIDASGGGSPNWWGASWGPRITAAGGGSAVSTGDTINGNGQVGSNVNVGLTSAGTVSVAPTGAWLTSAPTIAGALCQTEALTHSSGNLTVTVPFQGRPTAPNVRLSLPLTVILKPTLGGETISTTPTTDQNGVFTIAGVYADVDTSYTLRIKGSHTLAHSQVVLLDQGSNAVTLSAALREGDADNDNYVILSDFSILASAFGTATGDPAFNAQADFNGDGFVSLPDFSLLASNFGAVGPVAP